MNDLDSLNVWHEKTLVGTLWRNVAGMIGFKYETEWQQNGFSISQQLPLKQQAFSPEQGIAHRFFANLLPEANARLHIVHDLKIANSDFELLKALGGECAGALSLLPPNKTQTDDHQYRELPKKELHQLVLQKGQFYSITPQNERPRISLAGAQDKCPVFYKDDRFFIPKINAATTHILKFELPGYRNIPIYEYFLNRLANSIGLPVADLDLLKFKQMHFLLVKRYDRIFDGKKVIRIHQEDFCQALGVGYEKKYQEAGGPSFQDCYQLIQKISSNPLQDLDHLMRWQIFNVLAGNSDAHAKNISLIYDRNERILLAPFYDLVCTRAIERLDVKLAMAVGGEYFPDHLLQKHWEKLAKECNINTAYLLKTLKTMAETLLEHFNHVQQQCINDFGPLPALQRIKKVIVKQTRHVLNL